RAQNAAARRAHGGWAGGDHDRCRMTSPGNRPGSRPGRSILAVSGAGASNRSWPTGMRTPVFQSATFVLDEVAYEDIRKTGGQSTWWYTRAGNPTTDAAAARVAAL